MNKILIIIFTLILSAHQSYADQYYDELFMRDISIFLNSSETVSITLNIKAIMNKMLHIAMTDTLSEALYDEACPAIVSQSLLKQLLELSEITEKLLEPNSLIYNQNIQTFQNIPRYKDTILQDPNFVHDLSKMLKQMKTNYENIEKKAIKDFDSENLADLQARLQSDSPLYLSPAISDLKLQPIGTLAYNLFKYFLVLKKIKTHSPEILKIDNFLVLIIPQNYLQQIKTKMREYLSQNKLNINDNEINLGLKYNNLKPINNPLTSLSYSYQNEQLYQNYIDSNFIKTLFSIFFTKNQIETITDVALKEIYTKYLWNIVLSGHGSKTSITADMPEKIFLRALNFFNSQINTNLVFVSSCYSGSEERIKPLSATNLNYILAIGGITQSTTGHFVAYTFTINEQKELELFNATNISKFFQTLRRTSGASYMNIFNHIQNFWKINMRNNLKFYSRNIPQIKLPNTEWFQIIDLQKNELNLNKLLIELHTHNKKPLVIKNKHLLFLNSKYKYGQHPTTAPSVGSKKIKLEANMDFPIIIQGPKAPMVIPMDSESAKYNFELIDARKFSLSYLALRFIGLSHQLYNRNFNIKSLVIKSPFQTMTSYYKGINTDWAIFKPILSALKISHDKLSQWLSTDTIILKNVTIKVRTVGPKPLFRLKFEFIDKRYIIEQSTYEALKDLLKPENDLVSSEFGKSIISSPLKPTSKYTLTPGINFPDKGFKKIETALQKQLEKQKHLALQHKLSTLQILSQTLYSLSSNF